MSEDKPFETVNINLDDLQEFTLNGTQDSPAKITNWLSVNSQLHVEGLNKFRNALSSPYVTGDLDSVKHLRNNHLVPLLEDLEKLSKRAELSSNAKPNIPKFSNDFYKEVHKPDSERSTAFKEFLNEYSKLTAEGHFVEKISAQMLIDSGKEGVEIGELKTNLESQLQSYKQSYATQTRKDIGARELIMLKDESGKTKAVTMEELESSKDIKLTGEQRDFIKSAWQQGSFSGGWYTASTSKIDDVEDKISVFNQNSLLIDTSVKGKTYVSNQVQSNWKSISTGEISPPYATGTLIADITELNGKEFVPGCATAKPKINVIISKHGKEVDFIPDKLHTTTSSKHLNTVKYIKSEFAKGYYNTAAQSKDEKLVNMALLKFKADDPVRYKIEVEKFKSKEHDLGKIENFASDQVDKFSRKQNAVLNTAEKNRIKEGIITILEPLCQNEQELKNLKDNAGKLVRDCAKNAGKDMSWRESWKTYTDKAKNIVSKLIRKENNLEKLVDKYPQVAESLRKNLTNPQNIVKPVDKRSPQVKSISKIKNNSSPQR